MEQDHDAIFERIKREYLPRLTREEYDRFFSFQPIRESMLEHSKTIDEIKTNLLNSDHCRRIAQFVHYMRLPPTEYKRFEIHASQEDDDEDDESYIVSSDSEEEEGDDKDDEEDTQDPQDLIDDKEMQAEIDAPDYEKTEIEKARKYLDSVIENEDELDHYIKLYCLFVR